LHCWEAYEICYKAYATLPTSPQACCYTNLGNYKFQFSADLADTEENAYKLRNNRL